MFCTILLARQNEMGVFLYIYIRLGTNSTGIMGLSSIVKSCIRLVFVRSFVPGMHEVFLVLMERSRSRDRQNSLLVWTVYKSFGVFVFFVYISRGVFWNGHQEGLVWAYRFERPTLKLLRRSKAAVSDMLSNYGTCCRLFINSKHFFPCPDLKRIEKLTGINGVVLNWNLGVIFSEI